MEPSEEERIENCKEEDCEGGKGGKREKEIPEKFAKLFSSLDLEAVDTDRYQEALKDILSPPSAQDLNEQIIREGLRRSPEVSPIHVVLLAEAIPSWLPVIDGWGAERLFLYCEREEWWYRANLDLVTPLSLSPTVAGLAKADWVKQSNKIIIVQGSASFCRKMTKGLSSISHQGYSHWKVYYSRTFFEHTMGCS